MSFGPKLDWIKNKKNQITIKKIILFILSILISFFIVKHLNTKILYLTILMSVSVYLFFVSIIDLKNKKLKISQKFLI